MLHPTRFPPLRQAILLSLECHCIDIYLKIICAETQKVDALNRTIDSSGITKDNNGMKEGICCTIQENIQDQPVMAKPGRDFAIHKMFNLVSAAPSSGTAHNDDSAYR